MLHTGRLIDHCDRNHPILHGATTRHGSVQSPMSLIGLAPFAAMNHPKANSSCPSFGANGIAASVAVIGGGPAGLMAAEVISLQGHVVHVFDRMPSVGRKFLLAGKGGLNLTHGEPKAQFRERFFPPDECLQSALGAFANDEVREWAQALGIATFVGSSGRVFPSDMKAAPLLRAWLHRLKNPARETVGPVHFHQRHRWTGWDATGALMFETPLGQNLFAAKATVLALGGASWSRLGSDGSWVQTLSDDGVQVAPLRPSNCGFDVAGGWTSHLRERFAGQPIKSMALAVCNVDGNFVFSRKGECVLTATGLEGSVVYAASRFIREQIDESGSAQLMIDLLPDWGPERVAAATTASRAARSLGSHLRSKLGLDAVKVALLHEQLSPEQLRDPLTLAQAVKALPVRLVRPRPIDEAISTAGGVRFASLDERGMLKAREGVFCAGEMLDWDAPTGGYLLTASLSLGRWAGLCAAQYLRGSWPAENGTGGRWGVNQVSG